jgi:hypothetical protein
MAETSYFEREKQADSELRRILGELFEIHRAIDQFGEPNPHREQIIADGVEDIVTYAYKKIIEVSEINMRFSHGMPVDLPASKT